MNDKTETLCELGTLRRAIIENTKGDLFWIGEILLSELEKETGFERAHQDQVKSAAEAIKRTWDTHGEVPFPLYEREATRLALAAIAALRGTVDDNIKSAARALLLEIDKQRGRKVDRTGILDPMHPICIFAAHLNTAMLEADGESPDGRIKP